jgi:superfamily I DNA/RNA helicase
MTEGKVRISEEDELKSAIEAVLRSSSRKKLLIAGPGAGKTTLFKFLLESKSEDPERRIVLTFINNLKDDLEGKLRGLANVHTLHSFCMGLLHRDSGLRGPLSPKFSCFPGLATLIAEDWNLIRGSTPPHFVAEMRTLSKENNIPFYLARGEFYDSVDFDDSVYRVYEGFSSDRSRPESYSLVLIDEYQDFNALEAGVIDILAEHSPILIAGDDDQALYSQLRNSSWEHIRRLHNIGEYEVFLLPFCMRCPKVIVDAVNDVIIKATILGKLGGRIKKPYKHFPPAKGADSTKYPKIAHIETSVQRQNVNYFGRYLAHAISQIPTDEIEAAKRDAYPAALIIAAQPYREQVIDFLQNAGVIPETKHDSGVTINREIGLSILKEDSVSNLGWRVVLGIDELSFFRDSIIATADGERRLIDLIPSEYRKQVLAEASNYEPVSEDEPEPAGSVSSTVPSVKITSFEGAKGLSAQHVFIVGLHNHELPRDPASILDLEICKFIVGLTRTRKKCSLIRTRNFAGKWMTSSAFISWISPARLEFEKIDKEYWKHKT